MFLCYIDESGTTSIPGNTSHFILAGLSIPIQSWKTCDHDIAQIKEKYALLSAEIHTAWILRKYLEQSHIPNFDCLSYLQRRSEVERLRKTEPLQLQRSENPRLYKQTKKNYQKTTDYIHLTLNERRQIYLILSSKERIEKIRYFPQAERVFPCLLCAKPCRSGYVVC